MDANHKASLTMSEIMKPEKENFAGNVHGGYLLELLDRVAYACAARYAGCYVVTLSVDQVLFKQPIHIGELVTCQANVNYVGHSSMEIGIRVSAENLTSGSIRHTNTCYFTMVALDEQRRPCKVPPLAMDSPEARRHHQQALLRRKLKKEMEQQLKDSTSN